MDLLVTALVISLVNKVLCPFSLALILKRWLSPMMFPAMDSSYNLLLFLLWLLKLLLSKDKLLLLEIKIMLTFINTGHSSTLTNGVMLNSLGSKLVAVTVLKCLTLTVKSLILFWPMVLNLPLLILTLCLLKNSCSERLRSLTHLLLMPTPLNTLLRPTPR